MSRKIKLLTEFEPKKLVLAGAEPERYLKELIGLGFKIYDIQGPAGMMVTRSIEELLGRYTFENSKMTNLFCVR